MIQSSNSNFEFNMNRNQLFKAIYKSICSLQPRKLSVIVGKGEYFMLVQHQTRKIINPAEQGWNGDVFQLLVAR